MTTLVFALALVLPAQEPAKVSASGLIGKMFAKYATAETLLAKIRLTQSTTGASVTIDTDFQSEKPSKLYIRQTKGGQEPRSWLVTSDGVLFSYDNPNGKSGGFFGADRFMENVHVQDSVDGLNIRRDIFQTNKEIYVAARKSLGDRNAVMDILIGRSDDLRVLANQWFQFGMQGKTKINDVEVYKIIGGYIGPAGNTVSGSFELYIKEDGEFVRYVTKEKMTFTQVTQQTFEVVSTWDASILVNAKVNASLFTVLKPSKG